jgi:hypothetical protein
MAPYNFLSVMHPPNWGNSWLPRDPTMEYLITEYHTVSHYDRYQIVHAYGCTKVWEKSVRNYCKNFGYLGQNCVCICPPQTSGNACERKQSHTLPAYPSEACGGHIHKPGTYRSAKAMDIQLCTWWIQPPKCKIAVVTITEFNLKCSSEKFGVRSASIYETDEKYRCGRQIKPRSKFIGKEDLVVDFRSSFKPKDRKGYVAFNVSFELDPACANRTVRVGECPRVKYTDGSIAVPIRHSASNCASLFKFPGAKSVRAATRISYHEPSRLDLKQKEPFYHGFVEIVNSKETKIKKPVLEYFSHVFPGNAVTVRFQTLQTTPEYKIVLYPIMTN